MLGGVAQRFQRRDFLFTKELFDGRYRVPPGGDRDNGKRVAAEILLQGIQRRHFLAAWRTPCGPKIQQHVFALEFIQRPVVLVHIQQAIDWQIDRNPINIQLAHFPLSKVKHGLPVKGCGCNRVCKGCKGNV